MPFRKRQTNFYTFNGEKLRKTVEDNGTITKVDYCGPFVYETVSGTRSLKYIVTPEGRAVKNGSAWENIGMIEIGFIRIKSNFTFAKRLMI